MSSRIDELDAIVRQFDLNEHPFYVEWRAGTLPIERLADYADEWRGVLEDPAKLERFVSFVNAPDVPDPTITFVTERGQPVPGQQPVALAMPLVRT